MGHHRLGSIRLAHAHLDHADNWCYIPANESTVLDQIQVGFYQAWEGPDRVRLDNIVIAVEEPPSAIPVADAGPDLSGEPDQYYTLDGSGSTDDVGLVRYRWATGDHWDAILYDGSDPAPSVIMPGGAYTVMLEVFDGDGLRDTDFMECSFEYEPTDTVIIDFEPDNYTTGPLHGQGGWFEVDSNGTATVIDTDNGPSGPGGQCLELDNHGFPKDEGAIRVQKAFADLVVHGGQYITYQYDYRRVTDDIEMCKFWLPGAKVGHWADNWSQWEGAKRPNGDEWAGWGWCWPWEDRFEWHTHTWTLIYSDHDGGRGQLLSFQYDNDPPILWYPYMGCYMRDDFAGEVDNISLLLEEMWHDSGPGDDTVKIDNVIIHAQPLPSAIRCDPGSGELGRRGPARRRQHR